MNAAVYSGPPQGRNLKYYNHRSSKGGAELKVARVKRSELSLRERNKLAKRQRICAAARTLFSKHGYDAATLRQIARSAHVGLGTLFNYAEDKRDLIFLIFNEELSLVTDEALRVAQSPAPLIEQLMAIFRCHYIYFAKDAKMSRILLRELVFYSEGKQAAAFLAIRERLLSGIERLIDLAKREKRIHWKEDSRILTRYFFFLFSAEIRWWIASSEPKISAGLRDLNHLLELQIHGLQPPAKINRMVER